MFTGASTAFPSAKTLTDSLAKRIAAPAAREAPPVAPPSKLNAVFAIHGISPTQRYAFQDQVAVAFQSYLNAQEQVTGSGFSWDAVVHWPRVGSGAAPASVRPSALRIYRSDENDPENPAGTIYDIYEGYWSPLSKGKTNIASALRWLLNSTFLASSSTASIPCDREKLMSDLRYVGKLLGVAVLALAVAILIGLGAWVMLMQTLPSPNTNVTFWSILANPIGNALKLPVLAYVEFGIDLLVAYVLAQLFVVYQTGSLREQRTQEVAKDAQPADSGFIKKIIEARALHRGMLYILWGALIFLIAIAYLFGWLDGHLKGPAAGLFPLYAALVVASVGLLQVARATADFAVENILGDVQIYSTHDNNSTFYTIRQQIIQTVVTALTGVLGAVVDPTVPEPEPYYEAIHIFGHSLGSTIGMDALILLRQMVQEKSLPDKQWERIRSFTTFGTALEKTRFFFDVRQPTINAGQDQWENDVYGRFFTDKVSVLKAQTNTGGIYWSNYWYFRDIVANEIVSYMSDVQVDPTSSKFVWTKTTQPRPICKNYLLKHDRPLMAWVHSDYLADPLFWANVGPVVIGGV